MSGLAFTPLLHSWTLTILLDILLFLCCGTGFLIFWRHRNSSDSTHLDWLRRWLITIVAILLTLGPSVVTSSSSNAISDTDVFFAVDVTGSMAVDDAHYGSNRAIPRIQAAKDAVENLVSMYPGAAFAGVTFGASATLALEPTTDVGAVQNWLRVMEVEPTDASNGTQLSEPVDTLLLAMQKVKKQYPRNIIVLYYISDGEQTRDVEAASFSPLRQFVDAGAALGVGSVKGGKVPFISPQDLSSGQSTPPRYLNEPGSSSPAISKMNPQNLKEIADQFSGTYLHLDQNTTVASLSSYASHSYLVRETDRKHSMRDIQVWPLAIVMAALLLWECGSDIFKQRKYQ
ncbi:MAG: VWA domain-containing protein [Aeriscardovia sp.]|nr:VWA domain-containing protein [Aeriscardovia sp.]